MIKYSEDDLKFIENNNGIDKFIESYSPFFEKYFCFSQNEIEILISKLISLHDSDLIFNLLDLYENFVNEEITDFNKDERKNIANKAVNFSIDYYSEQKNKSVQDFIEILKQAKKMGADPIKLVNKTTIRNATFDSYSKCLNALYQHIYTDKIFGEKFTLIKTNDSDDELNKNINLFLEQCTSVICKLNSQNVQAVLDTLSNFFYDETNQSYILNPKDAVEQVKSLLITKPERLEENMNFILETFSSPSNSNPHIKLIVASAPSCLLCSKELVLQFIKDFKSELTNLIYESRKSQNSEDHITAKDLIKMLSSELQITDEDIENNSENFHAFIDDAVKVFCLENLNNIDSLNKENLSQFSRLNDIFIQSFGFKNSISCMQDFNFLQCNPILLDYILLAIQENERNGRNNLREYILRHSAKSVKLVKQFDSNKPKDIIKDFEIELTNKHKKPKTIYKLPKAQHGDIETKKNRLNNSQLKTAEKLINQILVGSKDSKDLDIELIEKLSSAKTSALPILAMIERAEIALNHKQGENKKLLSEISNFKNSYSNCVKVMQKLIPVFERSKEYYKSQSSLPEGVYLTEGNEDQCSVSECLDVLTYRSDRLCYEGSLIQNANSKLVNISKNMAKNSLVDTNDYEQKLSNKFGKECQLLKIEGILFSFINHLIEKVEEVYPEKSMEILGKDNFDNYLKEPFLSSYLIKFLLMIAYKNSNFLYIVEQNNDFYELTAPKFLKGSNNTLYQEKLKQSKFQATYFILEEILEKNLTKAGSFSVSENYRSVTASNGNTFVIPKNLEAYDTDYEAELIFGDVDTEDSNTYSLDVKGLLKMLEIKDFGLEETISISDALTSNKDE